MKSRCFAIRRIFTLLVCLLPVSAWAFTPLLSESQGQLHLGWPLNEVGTRYDANSGPILVRLNTIEFDEDENPSALSEHEIAFVTAQIIDAISRWNNVTRSFLELEFDGYEETTQWADTRDYILISYMDLGTTGGKVSWTAEDGLYMPTAVRINGSHMMWPATVETLTHELGHAIGLGHSEMTENVSKHSWLQLNDSQNAAMGYGDAVGLSEDDRAALRHTFPATRGAERYGSIRGALVNADGSPIFGGRAFVVDDEGRTVSGVLTGLNTYGPDTENGGDFHIQGLEPGNYTLVLASMESQNFNTDDIGEPSWPDFHLDGDYTNVFADTVVGALVVEAGETVNVANVYVGTITGLLKYHSEFNWDAVEGAQGYLVEVYDIAKDRPLPEQRVDENRMVVRGLDKGIYEATVTAILGRGKRQVVVHKTRFEFHPDSAIYPDDYTSAWSRVTNTEDGFDIKISYRPFSVEEAGEDRYMGKITASHESGEDVHVKFGSPFRGDGEPDTFLYLDGGVTVSSVTLSCTLRYPYETVSIEAGEDLPFRYKDTWYPYNDSGKRTVTVHFEAAGVQKEVSFEMVMVDSEKDIFLFNTRGDDQNSSMVSGIGYFPLDTDGDYVPDADDAYPNDPKRAYDSDGDGIANSRDDDDDNDGVIDTEDAFRTDASESVDSDGDGYGDNIDGFDDDALWALDSDGDGIPDEWDLNDGIDDFNTTDCHPWGDDRDVMPAGTHYICVANGDRKDVEFRDGEMIRLGNYHYVVSFGGSAQGDPDSPLYGISYTALIWLSTPLLEDVPTGTRWEPIGHAPVWGPRADIDGDGLMNYKDADNDGDGADDIQDAAPDDATIGYDIDADWILDTVDDDDNNDGRIDAEVVGIDAATTASGVLSGGVTTVGFLTEDVTHHALSAGEEIFIDGDTYFVDSVTVSDGVDGSGRSMSTVVLKSGLRRDVIVGSPWFPVSTVVNGRYDSDGDGIADYFDNFPHDPTEFIDIDGDGVGENSDNCDGNEDLTHDNVVDTDGDGCVGDQDAFPEDSTEWADSDGDGVGDNRDDCPFGGGKSSNNYQTASSIDTLISAGQFGSNGSIDIDGDGHCETTDLYPEDPNEWSDIDGDGVPDNSDHCLVAGVQEGDDDWISLCDYDGDGIGNNLDEDKNGNGYPDFIATAEDGNDDRMVAGLRAIDALNVGKDTQLLIDGQTATVGYFEYSGAIVDGQYKIDVDLTEDFETMPTGTFIVDVIN